MNKCIDCTNSVWKKGSRCKKCFAKSRLGAGNPMFGRKQTELGILSLKTRKRSHVSINVGEKNGQWKGENVGYFALHGWVRRRIKKPSTCNSCKSVPPCDLANISQEYRRDVTDWEWLCRRCHMTKDGRIDAMISGNAKKRFLKKVRCNFCKRLFLPKASKIKNCSLSCGVKSNWESGKFSSRIENPRDNTGRFMNGGGKFLLA